MLFTRSETLFRKCEEILLPAVHTSRRMLPTISDNDFFFKKCLVMCEDYRILGCDAV
jgi:hypothetical protein